MYILPFPYIKKATLEVAYNHSRKNGGSLIWHKDNNHLGNNKAEAENNFLFSRFCTFAPLCSNKVSYIYLYL